MEAYSPPWNSFCINAVILAFCLLNSPNSANSEQDSFAGRVQARYVKNYDADTIDLIALPWPGITIKADVRARLVDAPEIKGKCQAEKELAIKARDAVRELLTHAHRIVLSDIDTEADPYGRVLATVEADGILLHEWLILQGLARPYGDGRKSWCGPDGELVRQGKE